MYSRTLPNSHPSALRVVRSTVQRLAKHRPLSKLMESSGEQGVLAQVPTKGNLPAVLDAFPDQKPQDEPQEDNCLEYTIEYSDSSGTHSETSSMEEFVDSVPNTNNIPNSSDANIARNIIIGKDANHFFHPWGVVDYHLLLSAAERRTLEERRNCMYLINEDGCVRVREGDLFDDQYFGPVGMKRNPKLLFSMLPVAEAATKGQRFFGEQHYILGFDFNKQAFFARHFHSVSDDDEDIWGEWTKGDTVYSVTVPELLDLLNATFSGKYRVDRGILSSTRYHVSQHQPVFDDPGLELTIVIQFCQWMIDCADVVIRGDDEWLTRYMISAKFGRHMETCRAILHRASYRSWFAYREGTGAADYKRKLIIDVMASDLYLIKESSSRRLRDET